MLDVFCSLNVVFLNREAVLSLKGGGKNYFLKAKLNFMY